MVNVSWEDAKRYTEWLSRKTGHDYRLLSEAEWEYAARANTRTEHPWGGSAHEACGYANVHDQTSKRENKFSWASLNCDDGYAQTAPVGSFEANEFGLHDMLGNVWEWVADCWNGSYENAPLDSNVWRKGDCRRHISRGGSWGNGPKNLRSAGRVRSDAGDRGDNYGFRIAKNLQ